MVLRSRSIIIIMCGFINDERQCDLSVELMNAFIQVKAVFKIHIRGGNKERGSVLRTYDTHPV